MKKKNILISTLTPLALSSAVLPLANAINLSNTKNLNYIKTSESSASITDEYGTKWDVKFYDTEEENRYCEVTSFVVGYNKAKEEQLVNKVIIPEKFTFEEKDYKLTKISGCTLATDVKQIEFLTFFDAKNLVEIADNCFKDITIKQIAWVGCYNLKTIGNHAFDGVGVVATKENNIIDLSATVVETIGDYAFYNFSVSDKNTQEDPSRNAWHVILPKTLKEIGDYAFNGETNTVTDKSKQKKGIIKVAVGAAMLAASIISSSILIHKYRSERKDLRTTGKTLAKDKKETIIIQSQYDQIKNEVDSLEIDVKSKHTSLMNDYQKGKDVWKTYMVYQANPEAYKQRYRDYYTSRNPTSSKYLIEEMVDLKCSELESDWESIQEGSLQSKKFVQSGRIWEANMKTLEADKIKLNQLEPELTKKHESILNGENKLNTLKDQFNPSISSKTMTLLGVLESIVGVSGTTALCYGINELLNCSYIMDKSIHFSNIEFLGSEKPIFGENWAPRGLSAQSSKITVPKANSATLNSNPLQEYLNAPNATYKADGKIENTGKDITPTMYQESKIWFDETSNDQNVYKITGIEGASSTNEFSWKANHVQEKSAHKENLFYDGHNLKVYKTGELADKYSVSYQLQRAPEQVTINQRTGQISWSNELKPGTYHFNVAANLFEYTSDPQNPSVLLGPEYYSYVARAQSKEITLTILPNSKLLQIQTDSKISSQSTPIIIHFNGKREFDFDYGDEYLKTEIVSDYGNKIRIEGEKIVIDDDVPSGTTFTLNVEAKYIVGTTKGGTSFETRIVKQSKQFIYQNN